MGYTSVLAVIDRVPALRELSTAQVHIDSGISYATALIEGYLKARFQVPFSDPPPELIAVIAKELAAAYALKNAFSGSVTADQVMEADKMDAAAKGMLRDIVDGKLHLSDAVTKDSIPPLS